jgi:hypothetical protein
MNEAAINEAVVAGRSAAIPYRGFALTSIHGERGIWIKIDRDLVSMTTFVYPTQDKALTAARGWVDLYLTPARD